MIVRALAGPNAVGTRRRAGLAFTREPRALSLDDFEPGLAGLIQFGAILADPLLGVRMVEDGVERELTLEERGQIDALLAVESPLSQEGLESLVGDLLGTTQFEDPAGGEGEASGAAASDADPEPKASDGSTETMGGMDASGRQPREAPAKAGTKQG